VLSRLRTLLRRLSWRSPERAAIVVFDREGSEFLVRTVLEGLPHHVMLVRGERWFVCWRVCAAMLRGLRHIDWPWVRRDPRGVLRALPGELFKVYLYGYVCAVRPRAVLTYIDTSWHFMWLSRHYRHAEFFAIQNGARSARTLVDDAPPKPHFGHVMNMPMLFSFGDYERDLYAGLGQQVDRIIPAGSVRADWYLARVAPVRPACQYDICLVSQWLIGMLDGGLAFPDIRESLRRLDAYLMRYIEEHRVSCCIALRSDDARERAYFSRVYGDRAAIPVRDGDAMSSYAAIDRSELTMSMDSSIQREAYGWGKKVLFCNYSGREVNRSSPVVDLCYLEDGGYERFRDRVDQLRAMSHEHYRAAVADNARYLMRCEPERPSFQMIREHVTDATRPGRTP